MPGALQSRSAENARTCMQRQVPGARAAGPGRPRVQTAVPALGNAACAQSAFSAAGTQRVFGARHRRNRPVRAVACTRREERARARGAMAAHQNLPVLVGALALGLWAGGQCILGLRWGRGDEVEISPAGCDDVVARRRHGGGPQNTVRLGIARRSWVPGVSFRCVREGPCVPMGPVGCSAFSTPLRLGVSLNSRS